MTARHAPRVSDREWAESITGHLPRQWQGRLLGRWTRKSQGPAGADWIAQQHATTAANIEIRHAVEQLGRTPIPLDASDETLCARADELAAACFERSTMHRGAAQLRASMARLVMANNLIPPDSATEDGPAIARMTDPMWWRRGIRKAHGIAQEGSAITLGYVNRRRECYVSDQSLRRSMQQDARNAASLEATIATNELGQEYSLAELAAKGPANKEIRRAELMTRINGFERIAMDMGHVGMFFTVTCPSYMHRWTTGGHKTAVWKNPRYRGTTPREAQDYLCKVWARIRSALKRKKVGIYGFRIAEPNHDGTPHWHVLVFLRGDQLAKLREVVLRYALAEAPDEPGAQMHRVDFKPIDAGKGTAAGYIAKYVAKNIDGYQLGTDLYGNPAMEASARVTAWAKTWRIRQFQQIGGAPVGPWRELRRVKDLPESAPVHLTQAWRAVNKMQTLEGRDNASVAWDRYTAAQGGVFCGRKYRIRVATREVEGVGRYGEALGERPFGVSTEQLESYVPAHMVHMPGASAVRIVEWVVESDRHVWTIKRKRRAAAPWTCVNNCTVPAQKDGLRPNDEHQVGEFEQCDNAQQPISDWIASCGGGAVRHPGKILVDRMVTTDEIRHEQVEA